MHSSYKWIKKTFSKLHFTRNSTLKNISTYNFINKSSNDTSKTFFDTIYYRCVSNIKITKEETGEFILVIGESWIKFMSGAHVFVLITIAVKRIPAPSFKMKRDKRNTCWTWFLTLSESSFRFLLSPFAPFSSPFSRSRCINPPAIALPSYPLFARSRSFNHDAFSSNLFYPNTK